MRIIDAGVKAGQLTYGKKYAAGKPGEERKVVDSKHHVVVVR